MTKVSCMVVIILIKLNFDHNSKRTAKCKLSCNTGSFGPVFLRDCPFILYFFPSFVTQAFGTFLQNLAQRKKNCEKERNQKQKFIVLALFGLVVYFCLKSFAAHN